MGTGTLERSVEEQVFGTVNDLLSISVEVIVVIVLAVLGAVAVYWLGKDRILSLVLAFYGAFTLSRHFPFKEALAAPDPKTAAIMTGAVFVCFLALLYLALSRFVITDLPSSAFFALAEAAFLGTGLAGVIMLSLYHVVGIEHFYDFTDQVDALFASTQAIFWWLAGLLIGLLALVKR